MEISARSNIRSIVALAMTGSGMKGANNHLPPSHLIIASYTCSSLPIWVYWGLREHNHHQFHDSNCILHQVIFLCLTRCLVQPRILVCVQYIQHHRVPDGKESILGCPASTIPVSGLSLKENKGVNSLILTK